MAKAMYNIILDANVWVRFARNRNITPLLNRINLYGFMPVANRYLLSEIFNAVVDNKWMTEKEAHKIIGFIEKICVLTTENVVYRLSPDPKDNYLFDLAIQFHCPFIISDDTLLLAFLMQPVKVKSSNWFLKNFPI